MANFLKSLARGADRGMQNYAAGRDRREARQDRLDQRDEMQRRYEQQRQDQIEQRERNNLTTMLTLGQQTNNDAMLSSSIRGMVAKGMLPPAPPIITTIPEGETAHAEGYDRYGAPVDRPHPIEAGLLDNSQRNREKLERESNMGMMNQELVQMKMDKAIMDNEAGKIRMLGKSPFMVYPPTEPGGQERIEPLSKEVYEVYMTTAAKGGMEFVAGNTSTGYQLYKNPVTGEFTSKIDPLAVSGKQAIADMEVDTHGKKVEISDKAMTGRMMTRHQQRLDVAGIKEAAQLNTEIADNIMSNKWTRSDALKVIESSRAIFTGEESEVHWNALESMVKDFDALPIKFSDSERKVLQGVYYVQQASARLQELLEDPLVFDYVGRIDGTVKSVENFLTGEALSNPKLVEFEAILQDLKKGIIYTRSGAQVSELEFASYDKMLGTEFKHPEALKGRLSVAAEHSQTQREGIYRTSLNFMHRDNPKLIEMDWSRVPALYSSVVPEGVADAIAPKKTNVWSTSDAELED